MAIKPTEKDTGRRVRLSPLGAPAMFGKIAEVTPWLKIKYPDLRYPVATDPSKLDWADEELL